MNTADLKRLAAENMSAMAQNPYPGRGIVVGVNEAGTHAIQIYWIMGRSDNSRNRIFVADVDTLSTEAADPTKVTDPSLIIYKAMDAGHCSVNKLDGKYVVSNGHQTSAVLEDLLDGISLEGALTEWMYEPDGPNFTPRITGIITVRTDHARAPLSTVASADLAIIRKSPWDESRNVNTFSYSRLVPGFGFCISTYAGDGNPLPPFQGEPLLMPLGDTGDVIMQDYWHVLNPVNRVALAVKAIPLAQPGPSTFHVINRFSKVEPKT